MRLAEVLAGLSLATDLGIGQEPGHAMRTCLVSTGLARRLGLREEDVAAAFYTALLQHVGCTASAHEAAALVGDDVANNRAGITTDFSRPSGIFSTYIPQITAGRSLPERAQIVLAVLAGGSRFGKLYARTSCEVAEATARRLGLGEAVERGVHELFEWWNGKGGPQGLAGEEIALPARLANVAQQVALCDRIGGPELALSIVRDRAGRSLDPELAAAVGEHGRELLAELESGDALDAVLDAEPRPHVLAPERDLDRVARAFADVVDLKSPFLHGHSAGVAELAAGAAATLGFGEDEVVRLRRAGLLHDLGRVGVSSGIWEKPGALTSTEREQIRLHAYHTERILSRSPVLSPLAQLAGMHHERLDGSGYHRAAAASAIPPAARVLAAADSYQAMTQERPHRPALETARAAAELRAEARAGRLDADAVEAVLAAAGNRPRRRRAWPAGLSDRQVEVLRLVASGLSNREVAERLVISRRTAEHHVQDVYAKIGVSSRAAAALFAMEHGLLKDG